MSIQIWGSDQLPLATTIVQTLLLFCKWVKYSIPRDYRSSINPCHAEYFYVLHSSPIFILLTSNIPVLSM